MTLSPIEQGREQVAALAAKHPQTTWTPPRCRYEEPEWGPLTPDGTLGPNPTIPCAHAQGFHSPRGGVVSDEPVPGLRRRADGALHWVRPRVTTQGKVPKRTLENIAACVALGLSYWSEAPGANMIYAADTDQRAHRVRIDRRAGTAEHRCLDTIRIDPDTQLPRDGSKRECDTALCTASWAIPSTMDVLMNAMELVATATGPNDPATQLAATAVSPVSDVSHALGPTGHCSTGAHHRCPHRRGGSIGEDGLSCSDGTVYRCPCDCHRTDEEEKMPTTTLHKVSAVKPSTPKTGFGGNLTAAEKRERKKQREEREAAWQAHIDRVNEEAAARRRAELDAADAATAPPATPALTTAPPAMSREVARALLLHDPDYLGDITTAALVDLLKDESVKKYHPRIRVELRKNRGIDTKKVS